MISQKVTNRGNLIALLDWYSELCEEVKDVVFRVCLGHILLKECVIE